MKIKLLSATAALVVAAPVAAQTAPVITVTPTLAPNAFGSPSYAAWVSNSINAQKFGLPVYGTPDTPTFYQAQSVVGAAEGIVTGFASWKGSADPGTVYGPQYANELGNRMMFGIKIVAGSAQFSISQVSFSATSSDAGDALGFSSDPGFFSYSDEYVGVLKGNDGQLGTADDVYITSGANTQLVDEVLGRGRGTSFAAYCDGCTPAQQQQAIDDAAGYFTAPTTFTGTYSLFGVQGSGTFTILPTAAVPEPATWGMMIAGFGLAGAAMRRRRATIAFA